MEKPTVSPIDFTDSERRIEVYPSGKCFCPELNAETDQNRCASCVCYFGHYINESDDNPVYNQRFFVTCSFSSAG